MLVGRPIRLSKKLFKFISCLLNIPEDLGQQPRPQRFPRMHWDNSGTPIWMPEEMMTTLHPLHKKTSSLQGSD